MYISSMLPNLNHADNVIFDDLIELHHEQNILHEYRHSIFHFRKARTFKTISNYEFRISI